MTVCVWRGRRSGTCAETFATIVTSPICTARLDRLKSPSNTARDGPSIFPAFHSSLATYTLRDPRRAAVAILKQAKAATASDTALRKASPLVPMSLEGGSLLIASRGTKLNIVAIADHPAAAGTTNVSAIPKQYSNGRVEVEDRANVRVREYNSRRRCRRPDPKHGNVKRTNL